MTNSVFFSWQSDTPTAVGRNFIRSALEEACSKIGTDTEIDEALRELYVDSDTQGIAGQPPIVDTILKKIDTSGVFVADMTFVGTSIKARLTPNPNVLIEYGYALKTLGHERMICVMNKAYGEPSEQNLPFNLRHVRWPICFDLNETATPEHKEKVKEELITVLERAIRASLKTISPATVEPENNSGDRSFPAVDPKDGPARFRAAGEPIGFEEDFPFGPTRDVFLSGGPAMWLRVMPIESPTKKWPPHELKTKAMDSQSKLLPLLHGSGGYSFLRAEDGAGMYRAPDERSATTSIEVPSVAFVFDTGEIWSIDTALMSYDISRLFSTEIEKAYVSGLQNYVAFLQKLGIEGPFRWVAGIKGSKNRILGYPARPGHSWFGDGGRKCAGDLIEADGVYAGSGSTLNALLPFFKKIFEKCGVERPDYLPQE